MLDACGGEAVQDEPLPHGTRGSNDGGRASLGLDSGSDEGFSATAIQQDVPSAQREEDEVNRWRKLAQGAVLMLKRIDELTCVWTVLRKPGGYLEFPVFPWPGGPGYKHLIPSVERHKGFRPKWHDVEEDTGYTPK